MRRDHEVFQHREVGKHARELERAREPAVVNFVRLASEDGLAVKPDFAAGVRVHARNDLEQRGLAGTVRANQSGNRATRDLDIHALERLHTAEIAVQAVDG